MNRDSVTQFPSARKDQLIVKELEGEVLVYDLETDKAHCLNHTAALVWKYCDGKNTVSDIALSLGNATETSVDDRIIWLALDELEKFHLLEDAPAKPAHWAGMNRRQLIRNLGFAALALPIIVSIAAPTAKAATSCNAPGAACGSPNQCCSTVCCTATTVPVCPNNTCQ